MIYKFFNKKSRESGVTGADTTETAIRSKVTANQQLADELHELINRKFQKSKLYSFNMNNIRCADLADTQLISRYNKEIRFILCFIDVFSKYAWVIPLKGEKG